MVSVSHAGPGELPFLAVEPVEGALAATSGSAQVVDPMVTGSHQD